MNIPTDLQNTLKIAAATGEIITEELSEAILPGLSASSATIIEDTIELIEQYKSLFDSLIEA